MEIILGIVVFTFAALFIMFFIALAAPDTRIKK